MSSLTLLDRMLIIAQFELEAMQQGDVDGAISFFEERVALLDQLQVNQDENSEDCKMKLLALHGFQSKSDKIFLNQEFSVQQANDMQMLED